MNRLLTNSGEDKPNHSTQLTKISVEKRRKTIPEELQMEILARLPNKSIARFKSASKTWKSGTESPYFLRRYLSLRPNPSTWSLMFITKLHQPITEAIGFHGGGGDTWDLPNSLASYVLPFQPYPNVPTVNNYYVASSNGLIWIEVYLTLRDRRSFVGNPVSKQWIEIPPPPNPCTPVGLVTRVENGLVTSFKVVRTCINIETTVWRVYVYSSETGLWEFKQLSTLCCVTGYKPPVNVDGKLYLCENGPLYWNEWQRFRYEGFGFLVGYDFYGDDNRCQVVPLPIPDNKYVRRCLTTSRGDVMYVEILHRRLKVWRLVSSSSSNNADGSSELLWELSRGEINLASVGFDVFCFPLGMNPFDDDLIYLWSREHHCVVTGNLKTLEFVVHQESENWSSSGNGGCCRFNKLDSRSYMDYFRDGTSTSVVVLSQFVLPPLMDLDHLVPRLPYNRY